MGNVLFKQGKPDAALVLYKEVLHVRVETLSPEHLDMAKFYHK